MADVGFISRRRRAKISCSQCQKCHTTDQCPVKKCITKSGQNETAVRLLPSNLRQESEGLAIYRQGGPPNAEYRFDRRFSPHSVHLYEAEQRSGAHILVSNKKGNAEARIWGNNSSVKEAKSILEQIYQEEIRNKPKYFSNDSSYTYREDVNEIEEAERRLRCENFLKAPPSSLEEAIEKLNLKCYYLVKWVLKELPDKLLGQNLPALDSIRTDCHVYISIYKRKNKGYYIGVFGDKEKFVKNACDRVKLFQQSLNAQNPPPINLFIVKPVTLESSCPELKLRQIYSPDFPEKLGVFEYGKSVMTYSDWHYIAKSYRPKNLSESLQSIVHFVDYSAKLNARFLEVAFRVSMSNIHAHYGSLEMKVDVGTCAFTKYPGQSLHFTFMEHLLNQANNNENELTATFMPYFEGAFMEHRLLDRIRSNSSAFKEKHATFAAAAPEYTVYFELPHYWKKTDKLILKINFPDASSPEPPKWFNKSLSQSGWNNDEILAINILDFKYSSFSNLLSVKRTFELSHDEVDKLHVRWASFAEQVRMKSQKDMKIDSAKQYNGILSEPNLKRNILHWEQSRCIKFHSYTQSKTWKFSVVDTSYEVLVCLSKKTAVNWNNAQTPIFTDGDEHWSCSLEHQDWNQKLSQNRDLKIGQVADWRGNEKEFFPTSNITSVYERGQGIKEMLDILDNITNVIKG